VLQPCCSRMLMLRFMGLEDEQICDSKEYRLLRCDPV